MKAALCGLLVGVAGAGGVLYALCGSDPYVTAYIRVRGILLRLVDDVARVASGPPAPLPPLAELPPAPVVPADAAGRIELAQRELSLFQVAKTAYGMDDATDPFDGKGAGL